MINDMLFLAQTENSPETIRAEELDVAETIQSLFEYFDAWVEDRGVSLQLLGTASRVHADKEMFRRALSNLLSNAIRYTPPGQEVTVRVTQGADATTICVENPGPRIDPKDLTNLFSRFYRADPSRQRKGDGAGLGLAIVKTIVDAHGGEVYAESDDTSTRFYVTFPLLGGEPRHKRYEATKR
jgi:two-component system heavy metal sensor histidine kinase CusS